MRHDPRHYQIIILSLLCTYVYFYLDHDLQFTMALTLVGTAIICQYFMVKCFQVPVFDPRSAIISGMSLALLLRTQVWQLNLLAPIVAIGGKFLLRYRNKHLFNPSNFAIVVLLLASDNVWVSPGIWGTSIWLWAFLACGGSLILLRADRADITIAFLLFYLVVLSLRAIYLNDPFELVWFQLQKGALLIFAFFMLSDPVSTPDSRVGRIVFALLTVTIGAYLQFVQYQTNAMLYALFFCNPAVPVIDRFLPGARFKWHANKPSEALFKTQG